MFGAVEQLNIDHVHRGAADIVNAMDKWLVRAGVRENVARRRWLGCVFGLSKSLPGGGVVRDFDTGPVAGVNVVRRTLARRQDCVDDNDVVVLQPHMVVGLLFHGNRLVLRRARSNE